MTKKLGKTAQQLLTHIQGRREGYRRYGAVWTTGHGPHGGKINEGAREFAAAQELVAKGYADHLKTDRYVGHKAGWGHHVTTYVIALKGDQTQ